jgi:hypothetical protein
MKSFGGGTPSAHLPNLFPLVESPGALTVALGEPVSPADWSVGLEVARRLPEADGAHSAAVATLKSGEAMDGPTLELILSDLVQGETVERAAMAALTDLMRQSLNAPAGDLTVFNKFLKRGAPLMALLDQLADGQESRWRGFLSTAGFLIGREAYAGNREVMAGRLNRSLDPYRKARSALKAYGSDRRALMISLLQGANNLVLDVPAALWGTDPLQGADLAQANMLSELSRWLDQGNEWPASRNILFLVDGDSKVTVPDVMEALKNRGFAVSGLGKIIHNIEAAGTSGIDGYWADPKTRVVSGKVVLDYLADTGFMEDGRGVDVFALHPWSEEGLSPSQKMALRIVQILGGGVAKVASESMLKALEEKAKNDFVKIMA